MHLDELKYKKTDDEIVVEGLKNGVECPTELIIPEGVTEIAAEAFFCTDIELLVLPSSLQFIGQGAFGSCFMLSEVRFAKGCQLFRIEEGAFLNSYIKKLGRLPAALFEIEASAFEGCKYLKEVCFEQDSALEVIGENAFAFCNSLERIELPKKLYSIWDGAFSYCKSLDAIYIPKSVEEMGKAVFYGNNMHNITVAGSPDGRSFDEDFAGCDTEVVFTEEAPFKKAEPVRKTVSAPVKKAENKKSEASEAASTVKKTTPTAPIIASKPVNTMRSPRVNERGEKYTPLSMLDTEPCEGGLRIVLRPDSNIPPHTLYDIEELIVPPEVVEIGANAFFCSWRLKRIVGHRNLRIIRDRAFQGCRELCEVILDPETVLLGSVFAHCERLKYMRVTPRMYEYCFEHSGLERVDFVGEISEIREGLFYGCQRLKEIDIPSSVTAIMRNAFKSSGLVRVNLGGSLERIGESAFMLCGGLKSVVLPGGVTTVGRRAFFMSGLEHATLGNVHTIETEAFDGTHIERLTIPKSLTVIREDSFNFKGIKAISFEGRSREWVEKSLNFGFLTKLGKNIYYNC